MKKLLVLVVAVLMMTALTVPAFAEISPTAPVITTTTGTAPSGSNDSPTAPQTGYSLLLIPAVALAVAGAAGITVKTLSSKD